MPDAISIPEANLDVVEPGGVRRTVKIAQSPFLIGRGAEAGNHLQLSDPRISRQCASIVFEEGAFRVTDRGTRRGVFVNGEKVDAHTLRDGDRISFGLPDGVEIVFRASTAAEALPQLLSQFEQAQGMESGARDLRHLNLLLEATTLLQSQMPLEDVLGAMVDRAIQLTGADRGLLLERGPSKELTPLLARRRGSLSLPLEGFSPSKTALAKAVESRRSVVEEDVELGDEALRGAQSIIAQRLRSVIAIPLISHHMPHAGEATFVSASTNLTGALYLDNNRPLAFSKLERKILDTLALEAASILENAQLMRKERERMKMEQELATARSIQQALLPKTFPQYPHLEIGGMNRPCLAVGGDYYDLLEMGPGRAAFVIADVCGKGLGAALLTAILQGTFSAMTLGHDPEHVCTHVNQFISSRSEVPRYATLFFGMVDTAGKLEYINAGHLPPLLVRGGRVQPVCEAGSVPVGLFAETKFALRSFALTPGDVLVFFTDGITEAMNAQHDLFGVERLQGALEAHPRGGIEELQRGVLAAMEDFTRGAPQADDVTLLILRYRGMSWKQPGDTL